MNSTINKRYENFLKNNSEVKMLKDKIEQINVQKKPFKWTMQYDEKR